MFCLQSQRSVIPGGWIDHTLQVLVIMITDTSTWNHAIICCTCFSACTVHCITICEHYLLVVGLGEMDGWLHHTITAATTTPTDQATSS